MGLPIFREPEVIEAAKATVKTDASAHARSGIRRQRTIHHPSQEAAALRWRNRLARGRDSFNNQRYHPVREPTAAQPYEPSRERSSDLLRHVLRTDRTTQRARASRESLLRYAADGPTDSNPRENADRSYFARFLTTHSRLLSPPYSGVEHASGSPVGESSRGAPSWTPRFAPAYRLENEPVLGRLSPPDSLSPPLDAQSPDETPESGRSAPPLRRVGHMTISESTRPPSRHARLSMDGLGDRERSFSPEEDSWENLLTTIAPDEHLPSTDSSFTSAAATSFTSQPATSSSAQLTAPTSISAEDQDQDPDNDFLHDCNISETESTSSDASESRVFFPPAIPSPPPRLSNPPSLSPPRNHDLLTAQERLRIIDDNNRRHRERIEHVERFDQQARQRRERVREHRDRRERLERQRIERRQQALVENDQELGQMRAILERLSRREDIPDEWWAAAGLTRSNVAGGEAGNAEGISAGSEGGAMDTLGSQLDDLMWRISRLERERL